VTRYSTRRTLSPRLRQRAKSPARSFRCASCVPMASPLRSSVRAPPAATF